VRVADQGGLGFAMRPSVSLAIPYFGGCAIWLINVLLTAKFGPVGTPLSLISVTQLVSLSVVDTVFVLALAADGFAIRGHLPCIRRAELVGVVLSVANVLLLQVGVVFAYDPTIAAAAFGR